MIFNPVIVGGGAKLPELTSVAFQQEDWTENAAGDGYTLTCPSSIHQRSGEAFGYTLRHNVDGVLKTGTWAILGTQITYDAETGGITLSSPDAYAGIASFYG